MNHIRVNGDLRLKLLSLKTGLLSFVLKIKSLKLLSGSSEDNSKVNEEINHGTQMERRKDTEKPETILKAKRDERKAEELRIASEIQVF